MATWTMHDYLYQGSIECENKDNEGELSRVKFKTWRQLLSLLALVEKDSHNLSKPEHACARS